MGRRTSVETRESVIAYFKDGYTERHIGQLTNLCISTVHLIIQRFVRENRVVDKGRKAPNKIFSSAEEKLIIDRFKENPSLSSKEIAQQVASKELGKPCCPETIRRLLRTQNNTGRVTWYRPILSKINTKRRYSFAREHLSKDTFFWESVIFAGTCRFQMTQSTETASYVLSKWGQERLSPASGGGGIMVWACLSAAGVGNIVILEGKLSRTTLLSVLKENLQQSVEHLEVGRLFHYYHENDAQHKWAPVRDWLVWNCPSFIKQPDQSPDLNIIENIWPMLDQSLRNHTISDEVDLQNAILEEWKKITPAVTRELAYSMPNRLQDVVDKNGDHSKY